jgi:hypothetical protein
MMIHVTLLRLLTEGADLTAAQRMWTRVAALAILVAAILSLYAMGRGDVVDDLDLAGIAIAILASIVGLGQTVHRHSRRPAPPQRQLSREETGQHRTIRQPPIPDVGLPLGPSDFPRPISVIPLVDLPGVGEDDTDTERPPPLDHDDVPDTDPETPRAKREAGR